MTGLRVFLLFSTVMIYVMTALASINFGLNWPAVAMQDLAELSWRSQFDVDFIIYLLLVATWISWREGFTLKGHVFGFLSVFLGGMFCFPYLLHATFAANGDLMAILLGVHVKQASSSNKKSV